MKGHTHNFAIRAVATMAILIVAGFGASKAYGQCPDPNSQIPEVAHMGQIIVNLEAQGATVTCNVTNTSMDISVYFPSGLYANIYGSDSGMNMFLFDPSTGRTTNIYLLDDIDSTPTLIISDSVLGFFNATDGWFSVFYPMGNPFSAAIQNPLNNLMQGFFSQFTGSPGHPPAPIQGPGGIY